MEEFVTDTVTSAVFNLFSSCIIKVDFRHLQVVKRYEGRELMGPKRTQQPCDSEGGPWTSIPCVPWELVRNVGGQAPAAVLHQNLRCDKTPRWC